MKIGVDLAAPGSDRTVVHVRGRQWGQERRARLDADHMLPEHLRREHEDDGAHRASAARIADLKRRIRDGRRRW